MQKYRLVYETETEQTDILLIGKDNEYTNELELCFIDAFTAIYYNQNECIKYLYNNGIIKTLDGNLYIKRLRGKENAAQIFYGDGDIRTLGLEVCQKLKNGYRTSLSETREYKKCSNEIIKLFYSDEKALKAFISSFYANKLKLFVENLNTYLSYKDHDPFYEPGEIVTRELSRKKLYDCLKNYEVLREIKVWINNYKDNSNNKHTSQWKNPFEEYEKKLDESEIRKSIL